MTSDNHSDIHEIARGSAPEFDAHMHSLLSLMTTDAQSRSEFFELVHERIIYLGERKLIAVPGSITIEDIAQQVVMQMLVATKDTVIINQPAAFIASSANNAIRNVLKKERGTKNLSDANMESISVYDTPSRDYSLTDRDKEIILSTLEQIDAPRAKRKNAIHYTDLVTGYYFGNPAENKGYTVRYAKMHHRPDSEEVIKEGTIKRQLAVGKELLKERLESTRDYPSEEIVDLLGKLALIEQQYHKNSGNSALQGLGKNK